MQPNFYVTNLTELGRGRTRFDVTVGVKGDHDITIRGFLLVGPDSAGLYRVHSPHIYYRGGIHHDIVVSPVEFSQELALVAAKAIRLRKEARS